VKYGTLWLLQLLMARGTLILVIAFIDEPVFELRGTACGAHA
jgi:hypothetical protein